MSDFQRFLDENLSKIHIDDVSYQYLTTEEYDIYRNIREMIVWERKSQNISQKQLAGMTGISQANICKIEKGISKPTIESLKKIADALGKKLIVSFEDRDEVL